MKEVRLGFREVQYLAIAMAYFAEETSKRIRKGDPVMKYSEIWEFAEATLTEIKRLSKSD